MLSTDAAAARERDNVAMDDVRVISPVPRDIWWKLVESDPTCFPFQTPTGIDAICAAFNSCDESRLYEFPDGRQILLPLYRNRYLPRRLSILMTPKTGGPLSDRPISNNDLRLILDDVARLPFLRQEIRPTAIQADQWVEVAPRSATSVECCSHVIDLDGGFSTVWKERFNGQARRGVRKAEKAGLKIEEGSAAEMLDPYYGLLERSVDRWARDRGQPVALARWRARKTNSMTILKRNFGTMGDACRMWLAYLDGKPAAGIIVLFGHNAHYTRGAMDIELAGPSRASFLLQKVAIEDACNRGCRYYNMGESGSSENLARFKKHFGATEYRYPEYRFEHIPLSKWETQLRGKVKSVLASRKG